MICMDNEYRLIKFANIYQINYCLTYISTETSCVIGSELRSSVVADIADIGVRCSIIILR